MAGGMMAECINASIAVACRFWQDTHMACACVVYVCMHDRETEWRQSQSPLSSTAPQEDCRARTSHQFSRHVANHVRSESQNSPMTQTVKTQKQTASPRTGMLPGGHQVNMTQNFMRLLSTWDATHVQAA